MVIKWKDNLGKRWPALNEFHVAARIGVMHLLIILAIAFLFYGIEAFIESIFGDIDPLVDVVTAVASTFVFLWFSAALRNIRLAEQLRAQSEERASELERLVSQKTERIRQMNEAQSKFLVDIAHEFQTPIAILQGSIASLAPRPVAIWKQTGASLARANAVHVATTTLDRLSRLIVNLLDVAKMNFQSENQPPGNIDLGKLADEVCSDCSILAEDKGISLAFAVPENAMVVAGSHDKLKEVLLNLLSNALKYTPSGGSILINVAESDDPTGVRITVADTGCGISPENLPNVFARFYRIEDASNPPSNGMGIGLHICRQLIEAHHGTITAESELGVGSRFIIHLPLVPAVV